jgi:hypothetical protein
MKNSMPGRIIGPMLLIFLFITGWLTLPHMANGQDLRPGHVSPDQKKRSCIQSVDGYAVLSENMTISDTRSAAFANAKRQAVETARTYIQSKTKVVDFELKSDEITATSEGAVIVLEQKDHGVENNTRYHVWIKAEVEFSLKSDMKIPNDTDMDQDSFLTVKVWTSKKMYKDGESIVIYVQGNRDFYARIVDITTSGEIIQLLPNNYRKSNFFKAGKIYKIPDSSDRFDLTVGVPYGQDQIIVYASEVPLGDVALEKVDHGLHRYRGSRKELAVQTRGIAVMETDQVSHEGVEFYEASWTLTTGK